MSEIKVKVEQKPPQRVGVKLGISYAEDPTLTEQLDKLNGEVVGISSSAKIAAASASKEAIRKAIADRGGEIDDDTPLSEYDAAVWSIKTSGERIPGKHRVRFFDYDGTILKTVYTDGGAVEAPAVPDHERLLFQEWNNDFDNITDDLDVGAIYTTKSGKCEFDVWINNQVFNDLRLPRTVYMRFRLDSGNIVIDWGDGVVETLSTIGTVQTAHTYASTGKYMITVAASTGTLNLVSNAFSSSQSTRQGYTDQYIQEMRLTNVVGTGYNTLSGTQCCKFISLDKKCVSFRSAAFQLLYGLIHLNIPRNFVSKADENNMFRDTPKLKTVTLPMSATALSNSAFVDSGVMDVVIPYEVTQLIGTFLNTNGVTRIEKLTIPSKVTSIGDNFFTMSNQRGASLRTLVMRPVAPPTITTKSFSTDGSLKEIIVPKGCGEAYKSATNWSYYADIIREEEI